MPKSVYKVPGGKMLKIDLVIDEGKIDQITITGDFFLHPEESLSDLEEHIEGQVVDEVVLSEVVKEFLRVHSVTLIGASASDFAKAIILAQQNI